LCQGLEDEFDGANRKNLRRFIVTSDTEKPPIEHDSAPDSEIEEQAPATPNDIKTLYLAADAQNPSRELAVLPIMAVFHKFASGKGIPHSFVQFLRQYPALPRVVVSVVLLSSIYPPLTWFQVFLSVRVMPTARTPIEDKYIVTKVRSLDGMV